MRARSRSVKFERISENTLGFSSLLGTRESIQGPSRYLRESNPGSVT